MARQSKASTIPALRVRVRKRRQEIVDAAAEIFYEKGYEAASTQDIADKVGILKGSLYYYVESKEEFLFEVIKEQHQLSLGILERVRSVEGDGRDKLEALIHEHLRFYVDNRVKATVFFREYPMLTRERRAEIESFARTHRRFVTAILDEGADDGSLELVGPTSVAAIALTEMLNSVSRWYDPLGKLRPKSMIDMMTLILIDGFLARPAVRPALRAAGGSRSARR